MPEFYFENEATKDKLKNSSASSIREEDVEEAGSVREGVASKFFHTFTNGLARASSSSC